MSRFPFAVVATLGLLAVSACATTTTGAPPMSGQTPPVVMSCNADSAKPAAIGKTATAAVVERARVDAGARTARVLKPGQMVTMEYLEGRLNIDVDAGNVISRVRCG